MSPANATEIEVVGGVKGDKFQVGKIYEVKLTTGFEFKGIVLAYDPVPHFVIFQEGTMPETGNSMSTTRLVNASFISKLTYMGKFKDPLASKERLVDLSGLLEKEAIAIRKIKSIGVGVTAEAQKIFDTFAKTHPVQWKNKDILVAGDVRICSPYLADCVTGGTTTARNRIKAVLKQVRQQLQLGTGGN